MTSSVVGALRVNLGIDSAQFRNGLKQAQTGLQRFGAVARKAMLGLAAGATTAAGALAVSVKRTLNSADQIAKTADKIGIAVEDLQRLRHAADLSGVATKTLDMAMQRFSRRVGEAAQGGGELKGTLEKYNIAVRDSAGNMRSQVDILGDLSDAIKNAESDQEALRVAFKAFDSEGAALVNMLRGGSGAMAAMMAEADQLGMVIREDTARAAEQFNDNLTRLRGAFSGVAVQLAADLAPKLVEFTDWLVANAPRIAEITGAFITFGMEVVKAFVAVNQTAQDFNDFLVGVNAKLREFVAAVEGFTRQIVDAFLALPEQMYQIGVDIMAGLWRGIKGSFGMIRDGLIDFAKNQLPGWIRGPLGIKSPSRVMHQIGVYIMQGLVNGMGEMRDAVAGGAGGIAGDIQSAFSSIGSSIAGLITGTKSWVDVLKDALSTIAQIALQQLSMGGFGGFFSSLIGGLFGFANGGSFTVPGSGGVDSQLVAFKATPGETVDVRKPGQGAEGGLHVTFGLASDGALNIMPEVRSVSREEGGRAADRVRKEVPKIAAGSQRYQGIRGTLPHG